MKRTRFFLRKPSQKSTSAIPSHLSNRLLLSLWGVVAVLLTLYFSFRSALPPAWSIPGSLPLYVLGIMGAGLFAVSLLFVLVKRTGWGGAAPFWFSLHVLCTMAGVVLAVIHSAGALKHPPALLLLCLAALAAIGVWARLSGAGQMARTFATHPDPFAHQPSPHSASRLRELITEKTRRLTRLAPAASEGTFSIKLAHWLRHPWQAALYRRLEKEERRIIGLQRSLPVTQVYWRRLHIALGYIFMLGVVAHVVIVTFFAEYAAEGREVTWPHLG